MGLHYMSKNTDSFIRLCPQQTNNQAILTFEDFSHSFSQHHTYTSSSLEIKKATFIHRWLESNYVLFHRHANDSSHRLKFRTINFFILKVGGGKMKKRRSRHFWTGLKWNFADCQKVFIFNTELVWACARQRSFKIILPKTL